LIQPFLQKRLYQKGLTSNLSPTLIKMKKNISQKGAISILLAVLLLAELSVISLGIATLMIKQLKMSGQTGQSVVAYYAAEAGAERCLYDVRKSGAANCPYADVPLGNAKYTTIYNGSDTITSIGQFKSTSRKVELTWTP